MCLRISLLFLCIAIRTASAEDVIVRYQRALVFPGGGFQIAMFLGMVEEAELQGKKIDVVIGTCGGAIAAAIVNAFLSNEERKVFVQSEKFYRSLQSNKLEHTSIFWGLGRVIKNFWGLLPFNDRVPDVFNEVLLQVPEHLDLPNLNKRFLPSGIRAVIVGSRMYFATEDVGSRRNGEQLFQEVFFTDEETAQLLQGFQSAVGTGFAGSSVMRETDVVLGVFPVTAARASVADPYLVRPIKLNDYYYMTGAIDLYPLEVAHQLAGEVLMPFSYGLTPFVEQPAYYNAFRYNIFERLRQVTSGYATHWIDITDQSEVADNYGFDPYPDFSASVLVSGLPDNHEEYVKMVQALWEHGKNRMREALQTEKNSKAHIRNMDNSNTYRSLREAMGQENESLP